MKTIVMELRYHSEPGSSEPYSGLVDGINDVVGQLALRFSLDILSISHVVEVSAHPTTSITCTAVCALNGFTREQIGTALKAENGQPSNTLYCFLDACQKLSVRVGEIHYN